MSRRPVISRSFGICYLDPSSLPPAENAIVRPMKAAAQQPITLSEWAALGEDVAGELVDGQLEEEEMPSFAHELCVGWLLQVLRMWLNPQGFVFASDSKYGVSETRGRKPDVSVYLPGRPAPGRRAAMSRRPPSIAVEVITPTPRDQRRDRVTKLSEYARFGVPYYWLLDPELRTLEIMELDSQGRYVHLLGESSGVLEDVPGCDGLCLDLDALWAEIDSLPDEDD